MVKYVNLELTGTIADGFNARCEIGEIQNTALHRQALEVGQLPSAGELCKVFEEWQLLYGCVSYSKAHRGEEEGITFSNVGMTNLSTQDLDTISQTLEEKINAWFCADSFRKISDCLLGSLHYQDEILFTLTAEDQEIQNLPLHLWHFFDRYRYASFALGHHTSIGQQSANTLDHKFLVVLGDNTNINTKADKLILEQLVGKQLRYLEEPRRNILTQTLNSEKFSAIYFAGHSFNPKDKGYIKLNSEEKLSISDLKLTLKYQIQQGLRLAIFNSCNSMNLARELVKLGLPQIVVMRHAIPDYISQEFLKFFLQEFSQEKPLHLSVRQARERLEGWEGDYPYATWLPVLWQNALSMGNLLYWNDVFPSPGNNQAIDEDRTIPEDPPTVPAVELPLLASKGYQLVRTLGEGTFGKTFLVTKEGSQYAIKQLKLTGNDIDQKLIDRFAKEAKVLQELGSHPQIPTLYEYFSDDHEFYIVLEFIEGKTIGSEVRQKGQLSESETISLLTDALEVLSFVHSKNVIHRDIKPENLMRRSSDHKVILIDFGAVKEHLGTHLNLSAYIGTPGYSPEEQILNNPVFASDVYAIGTLAISLLSGLSPRENNFPRQALSERLHISQKFASFLEKCIARNASDRYKDAKEALSALRSIELVVSNPAVTPPKQSASSLKRVSLSTFLSTLVVIVLRYLGLLQGLELLAYDFIMRIRPGEFPDERIVFITIDDKDISFQDEKGWQRRGSIADAALELTINKLNTLGANTIGLDIYRDGNPDTETITDLYSSQNNFVGVCKAADPSIDVPEIPPPQGLSKKQIGFSDVPDDNEIIRRQLLFLTPPSLEGKCTTNLGFATQIARQYLASRGINPNTTEGYLQLGDVVLSPLQSHGGGYQRVDMRGHQVLLNYRFVDAVQSVGYRSFRSVQNLAPSLSLRDFLSQNIDPDQIKDKIVLIGVTSTSSSDYWGTPLSSSDKVAGLYLQGQMVSQLISAVLDKRELLYPVPFWQEFLWIFMGAGIGCGILLISRNRIVLVLITGVTWGIVGILYFALFSSGLWIPFVPVILSVSLGQVGLHLLKTKTHPLTTKMLENNHGA